MCTYSYCDGTCQGPDDYDTTDADLCEECRASVPEGREGYRVGDIVWCRKCGPAARAEEEAAAEADRLLSGGGAHPDDEAEPETVEVEVETMSEMVNGKAVM